MRKKGVSPLIAVVLLIAFTLAIGGFMSGWLHTVTQSQSEKAVESSKPDCFFVYLGTANEEWNRSSYIPKTLSIDVENTGTKNVDLLELTLVLDNGSTILYNVTTDLYLYENTSRYVNGNNTVLLKSNTFKQILLYDVNNSIRLVKITSDCPGKIITVKGDEITGAI